MTSTKELTLVNAEVLTPEEKTELDTEIDRIIEAHKENRREINRLVFESVAAMTEADEAGSELESKGFLRRFIGGITGSNQKLQNKINRSRAAAQYASQQTLQKLAEQNLMSFDLITAVNNKLNASMQGVSMEINHIYEGLGKFFRYNRSQLVRLEMRLARVERNIDLLTWQNSIEYLEFEGEEYREMDETRKIICLVRDFYDITKGDYSTSDLLLLKTAMSTIDIDPKNPVNYGQVIENIADDPALQEKLLGGAHLRPLEDPGYLISMGSLQKLDALRNEENYLVGTVQKCLENRGIEISEETVCRDLTREYMKRRAGVNLDIEVESFDMMLDLLYALKQTEEEKLLEMPQESRLAEAERLFLSCQLQKAYTLFEELGKEECGRAMYRLVQLPRQSNNSWNEKCGRAMYYLGEYYTHGYGNIRENEQKARYWREKGAEAGDVLASLNCAYLLPENSEKQIKIFRKMFAPVKQLAEAGDPVAQIELSDLYSEGYGTNADMSQCIYWLKQSAGKGYWRSQDKLGSCYYWGEGVEQDYEEAVKWYRKAAEQGYNWAQNHLGGCYKNGKGVEQNYGEAVKWYRKAAEQGYDRAQYNLGICCWNGQGIEQNYEEAVKWWRKAAEQGFADAQCYLGECYRDGEGVGRDYTEARKWFQKAAEQGNERAQNNLKNL